MAEFKRMFVRDLPDDLYDLYTEKGEKCRDFLSFTSKGEFDVVMSVLSSLLAELACQSFTDPSAFPSFFNDLVLANLEAIQEENDE